MPLQCGCKAAPSVLTAASSATALLWQYLHPYKIFGRSALLTVGSNFHDNQINVDLLHDKARQVLSLTTSAHAHVTNTAGYFQQGIDLLGQRLHLDAGLRWDYFRFNVNDRLVPTNSGIQDSARFQPKANVSYTPSAGLRSRFMPAMAVASLAKTHVGSFSGPALPSSLPRISISSAHRII